jgi:hypothetical protein
VIAVRFAIAAAAVAGCAKPAPKPVQRPTHVYMERATIERGARRIAARHGEVDWVSCDERVEIGTPLKCIVKFTEGPLRVFEVLVTGIDRDHPDDHSKIDYDLRFQDAVLDQTALRAGVLAGLDPSYAAATADCGNNVVQAPGAPIRCTLELRGGGQISVDVTGADHRFRLTPATPAAYVELLRARGELFGGATATCAAPAAPRFECTIDSPAGARRISGRIADDLELELDAP